MSKTKGKRGKDKQKRSSGSGKWSIINSAKTVEEGLEKLYTLYENEIRKGGYDKESFINNMKSLMEFSKTKSGNPSYSKAYKAFSHKIGFITREELGAENLWKALKDQDDFNAARKDVFGWRAKKEDILKDLKWNKDAKSYVYVNNKSEKWSFQLITGEHGSQYWKWVKLG